MKTLLLSILTVIFSVTTSHSQITMVSEKSNKEIKIPIFDTKVLVFDDFVRITTPREDLNLEHSNFTNMFENKNVSNLQKKEFFTFELSINDYNSLYDIIKDRKNNLDNKFTLKTYNNEQEINLYFVKAVGTIMAIMKIDNNTVHPNILYGNRLEKFFNKK